MTPSETKSQSADKKTSGSFWRHFGLGAGGAVENSLQNAPGGMVNPIYVVATEAVWGALEDGKRVEILRYSLGQLKKRHIGWLAYLLHHSLIADAHREEFGPTGPPGNLSFIEADGTLRPGHEAFNDY